MSRPKPPPEAFERVVDKLFDVADARQLRQLRRHLAHIDAPDEPTSELTPPTPAEADAALDWLLDRIGYERA